MRAVSWLGEGKVAVEERPEPQLESSTDVVLRVTTSAVCGTDLHILHGKFPGLEPGLVLGHEFVGEAVEVGDGVRSVMEGGRYVASMFTACGTCRACSRADYRNCPWFGLFGMGEAFGDLQGGQADYVRVPLADQTLTEVPEGLTDNDVVLTTDILPTAYTALKRADVRHGDSVAVVGAGPVGQLVAMCAPVFGACRVFVVDLDATRLAQVEKLGAIPINPADGDPVDQIADQNDNLGVDAVIEAVGNAGSIATAFSLPKIGGNVAMIGMLVDEDWPISCGDNWLKEIHVHPVLGNAIDYRSELLSLIAAHRLDPASLISDTFSLDDAAEAYEAFNEHRATKAILTT